MELEDLNNASIHESTTPSSIGPDGQPVHIENTKVEEKDGPNIVSMNQIQEPPPKTPAELNIGPDGVPLYIENPEHGITDHEYIPEETNEEVNHVQMDQVKRNRRCATIFGILNSLMGAGILSVPNSCINLGLIPSVVVMIIISALSYIAAVMVLIMQNKTNATSLDHLTNIILGKYGSLVLSILNLLFLVSCLLGFLILGSDMIISWFKLGGIDLSSSMLYRAIMVFVYAMCIPIALSIPRNIKFLSYVSFLTVFCVLLFAVAVIYEGIVGLTHNGISDSASLGHFGFGIFSSIAIYGLSFALPLVFLPAVSMYNPDVGKREKASGIAQLLGTILVIAPAIFAYLQFGKDTKGNVLNSYPDSNILMVVVRSGFFIVVSCAYPMVNQSVLSSWSAILFKDNVAASLPFWKRVAVEVAANGIPLVIAMFLAEAKPALAIGGALGGCLAQFTFPAVMWIKASGQPLTEWKNILCIVFAVFGIVAGVISTYQAVVDAIAAFTK